jgi:catechol 2,3-dioxygenase-like lactoylglutathione lyase family enzyme
MRPVLIALQVRDLEASVRWYSSHLDFQPKDRRDFPGQRLKVAILALHDFELELVEDPKTLERAKLLTGDATAITGFAKVTFTVDDVARWFERLRAQGANFAAPLRDSRTRPGHRSFVVLDNENNWLQFTGPAIPRG